MFPFLPLIRLVNSSELGFDQLYDRLHFVDHVWHQFVLITLSIWFHSNLVGGKIYECGIESDDWICEPSCCWFMKWSFWSLFQVMIRSINSLVWNLTWAPNSSLQDLKSFMMNSVAIGLHFCYLKDYIMKDCNSMLYNYFRCPIERNNLKLLMLYKFYKLYGHAS